MNHNDLIKFREQLNGIRLNLSGLKEQAMNLIALVDDERLVPEEASRKLLEALKDYQEKSALLQKTGKEISLSLSDNLQEIERELKSAEDRERSAAELSLLLDYFRLTSEAEDVKEKLAVSKDKLRNRLLSNADSAASEYHPYKLTVQKVREPGSTISRDEFRELMDGIGFDLAWVLNESTSNLRIDPAIDPSTFTVGIDLGIDDLSPKEELKTGIPAQENSSDESRSSETEQNVEATVVEEEIVEEENLDPDKDKSDSDIMDELTGQGRLF